jgi:cytochrome P450
MAERAQELAVLANDLIDGFIERGHCDFSTEFAVPFPSAVFLRLMGLPLDTLDEFLVAKEGMIRPDADTQAEREALQAKTGAWIFEYFSTALETHSGDEDGDVLGTLLALERNGRLTRDETLNICLLMLAAGLDTVTDTLECAFAFLSQSPAINTSSPTILSSWRARSRSSCGSTHQCPSLLGSPPARRRSTGARSERVNGYVSCWEPRTTTLSCTAIRMWWTSGAR